MNENEETLPSDVSAVEESDQQMAANSVEAKEELIAKGIDISLKEANRSDASTKEESNDSIDGKDYNQVSDDSEPNPMRPHVEDNHLMGYDREFMYKLIISQLLYDGHRNVAINLSNNEKFKNLVQPSRKLYQLIVNALKMEGDSPLSDDSIHAMNLIDLDFDADRNSGSSRASLYDSSATKDYFRSRSYSPDLEVMPQMTHRMIDNMGRMIAKTSPLADPMPSLNNVSRNSDTIGLRSTPDIPMPPLGHPLSGSLRSMTPSGVEMVGQSGLLDTASQQNFQQIDFNDLLTQINLAQLAYMNTDPTASVASSSANTPSPTPIIPSVPLENGTGFVLNEAGMRNISQLAKLSESQNGMVTNSTSPTSMSSTLGRSSSNSGSKPNVMQIRFKFGQLGQQKGQFSSPHGFCLGVDEEIVIADTNNHRICIFDKTAEFKHSFGVPGKDEAQLWYPRKVAIIRTAIGGSGNSAPRYVICDRGAERSRMQIFTRSGHFVRKIAIRYIDIVAGLAITPNGHIVAVDSVSPTVFVIAESGDLLRWFDCSEYMREPSDIAINNHEYYICDFKGHCVVVFNDEGQFMRKIGCEGLTSFPNGIDISDAGDILVGDSHGNRFHVVVFDRSGTLISEFECPYVKVSRCCGLKITSEGYIVTLAKNNHHVLVLNTLYIM
ncbi:unnamed protein product [Medioppia subpectinata]|uniref:Cleavage stimulation factor subunit 1 dimerisation domain-containing protein n=1 Tax=Medioppia subpectinata TaxID=1979941 RepID=A0A7R9KJZ3_9ACAR|nr:unnamed protein product [Medioppia subpectinata]CAG2104701.1 unnamed protein product [Medioppia subpectinata]